jgi:hypothetical protein
MPAPAQKAARVATVDDLLAIPEDERRHELIFGDDEDEPAHEP